MQFLEAVGEVLGMTSRLIQASDGSWIAVQTDKPSYFAGETITGKVVAHITTPRVCDRVVLKVMCKEKVEWDYETSHTHWEGEGEQRRAVTHYQHGEHKHKAKLFKEVIVVNTVPHQLMPGTYVYPFSFPLRPELPGCIKFKRTQRSMDPHWHNHGRMLETKASVCYTLKAQLESGGIFGHDLKSREELVVNQHFDWSKMHPARMEKTGDVVVCCCVNKGKASLIVNVDKAAYAAGETAMVKALIRNESTANVNKMRVELFRNTSLRTPSGHTRSFADRIAAAEYAGVGPMKTEIKDMPLPFTARNGAKEFLPSAASANVRVDYVFNVVIDVSFAFDIAASIPVVIYTPAPAVWGLAAQFGGNVPAYAAAYLPAATAPPAGMPGYPGAGAGGAGAMPAGYQASASAGGVGVPMTV